MRNFSTVIQYLSSPKAAVAAVLFLVLTGGIFTTAILTTQTQDIRQRADSNTTGAISCEDCKKLSVDNVYFCRNAQGQTDCQPKDISTALPGATCIDCSMYSAGEEAESKNPIQVWWDTIIETINPDLNKDGKIDGGDIQVILMEFTEKNSN